MGDKRFLQFQEQGQQAAGFASVVSVLFQPVHDLPLPGKGRFTSRDVLLR